jgi:hypothetical protein
MKLTLPSPRSKEAMRTCASRFSSWRLTPSMFLFHFQGYVEEDTYNIGVFAVLG